MELKRDDIIKALKCCSGDIIECRNCAYAKKGYNKCKEEAARDALALIKFLAEENNRLSFFNEQKAEAVRVYTVREFADRLKNYYNHLKGRTPTCLVTYQIDQIAKEMICDEMQK